MQGQNNATDIFGLYRATPSNVLTTAVGSASGLGIPMALELQLVIIKSEEAANKLLGNPTNYMNNIRQPSNPNSAVAEL